MSKYFNKITDPKLFSCPHCGVGGPDPRLLILLDAMRGLYGKPIRVTSGPRCEAHNAAVGGKTTSSHLTGQAADLACAYSGDRLTLVQAALECGCKRIGISFDGGFIHVDVDDEAPAGIWGY
jgi:uncharacterized protein YcbK (DUF882 family)